MEIVAACPFPIGSLLWQPRAGTFFLTVVGKITFALDPHEASIAAEQEPIYEDDRMSFSGSATSLRAPSDLAPAKPRVEVLLVGHAHSPGRVPVRMLTARVVVGSIDKSVDVYGDRAIAADGSLIEGAPFSKMSIGHERAAGGPETWNPLGIRRDARTPQGHAVLPSLMPPGKRVPAPMEPVDPMSMSPIAPSWPIRRAKLGRHLPFAELDAWRSSVAPVEVDLAYFNVAPADQQAMSFPEPIALLLENLHPENPRVSTRLPPARWTVSVERGAGGAQPIAMRCDTLWIDTDRGVCTATYRGQVPLSRADEPGRAIVHVDGVERRADSLSARRPDAPPPPPGPSLLSSGWAQQTLGPSGASVPLPFSGAGASPSPRDTPVRGTPAVSGIPAGRSTKGKSVLPEGCALSLLWYEPESMGRIRRRAAWKSVLAEVEAQPIDPELDDPELSASPAEVENRRAVGAILSRCAAASLDAVEDALFDGVSDGTFTPKISLFEGDLTLPFDGTGVLAATVATVSPLASEDERLRASLRASTDFLATSFASGAGSVAEGLTAQIKEILRQSRRGVSPESVQARAERIALEQRCYQKRTVLGGPHVRALLSGGNTQVAQAGAPTFLPEKLAPLLPLHTRFRARILAEVHPAVDPQDTSLAALRVVALARVLELVRGGK